jgi:BMFP domain-containing protein YqiC
LRVDVKALEERVAQLEAKNQELETMIQAKADKSTIESALV